MLTYNAGYPCGEQGRGGKFTKLARMGVKQNSSVIFFFSREIYSGLGRQIVVAVELGSGEFGSVSFAVMVRVQVLHL